MRSDRNRLSDEELRELLRLGDPASDGHELSREEIAEMRRTVLNAVDTRAAAHPWLSRSLIASLATLAVVVIALAILLRAGPWGEVLQPSTGPDTPVEPAPAAVTEPVPAEPSLVEPSVEPATAGEVAATTVAEAVAVAEEPPAVPAAEPQAVATMTGSEAVAEVTGERQPRTVRFTAPGGTRIIWTLDPDFRLPVDEPDDGARGEM